MPASRKTVRVLSVLAVAASLHGHLEAQGRRPTLEEDRQFVEACARDARLVSASHDCSYVVQRLAKAGPAERARLWALDDSHPTSPMSEMIVEAILDSELADALAALPVVTPGPDAPASPDDLEHGRSIGEALMLEYRALLAHRSGPPRSIYKDQGPMHRAIARFLRGQWVRHGPPSVLHDHRLRRCRKACGAVDTPA